jgi:hypothetical protein
MVSDGGLKNNSADHSVDSVGFEVLTAVSTKMAVFWVVAPGSLASIIRAMP